MPAGSRRACWTAWDATDDFYFDVLRQVRMPRWSSGRVALCGDAAWCVTPVGGVGTTLAVTGARVLAGEIARTSDLAAAFAAYEEAMRPMVKAAQGVPRFAPRLANPHSRAGIRALHGVLALASKPWVRALTGKLSGGDGAEPDLTRYASPVAARPRAEAKEGLSPVAALGIVALVLGASTIVGRRNAPDPSHPGIRRWYRRLDKPAYTPPDAAFAAVWPVLESALAIGGYRLLRRPPGPARNAAVGLWLANSAMIGGSTELFFRRKRLGASAAASGAMVASGAALVATAAKVDRPAAALATPFVAWFGFATLLAARIRRDNPA
ncbi:tryptophan-rich sensory protein [Sphingomonas sp. MMS24-JH45]